MRVFLDLDDWMNLNWIQFGNAYNTLFWEMQGFLGRIQFGQSDTNINPISSGGGPRVPPLQENPYLSQIRMDLGSETF